MHNFNGLEVNAKILAVILGDTIEEIRVNS